jgi:NAD(P)-dependent dehydrogenase (short-subunit alcohol dehydrogenase family)
LTARQRALSAHPIGRLGLTRRHRQRHLFLASGDSAFMTGAGLVVDGGITAQ